MVYFIVTSHSHTLPLMQSPDFPRLPERQQALARWQVCEIIFKDVLTDAHKHSDTWLTAPARTEKTEAAVSMQPRLVC